MELDKAKKPEQTSPNTNKEDEPISDAMQLPAIQLQQLIGNQATQKLLRPLESKTNLSVQRKPTGISSLLKSYGWSASSNKNTIQRQVKLDITQLGFEVNVLDPKLIDQIQFYNKLYDEQAGSNDYEMQLLKQLDIIMSIAIEWVRNLPEHKRRVAHSLIALIRNAQKHAQKADYSLPMLTDRPWGELQQEGRGTAANYEFFENKIPEDEVHGFSDKKFSGLMKPENIKQLTGKRSWKGNYAVLPGDKLVFCQEDVHMALGGHIDLARGGVVLAAGAVEVGYDGNIKKIDNSSGHYLPKGASAKKSAIIAFSKAGFGDISGVYIEKKFDEDKKKWVNATD